MDSKKKTVEAEERASERVTKLRASFKTWQQLCKPRRLFCIDEAGSTMAMTPTYARAPKGQRAVDIVPRNRGTVTTILGALSLDGLTAMMTVEGGTSGEVFVAYVKHILLPELRPGDVVVMDNLGAHKDRRVRPLIESAGATVKYLPPYSPDLNPIEMAWSKLKQFLRVAKARTHEALDTAISMAMGITTPSDARGWYKASGYPVPET